MLLGDHWCALVVDTRIYSDPRSTRAANAAGRRKLPLSFADTLLHPTNSHAHARAAMICAVLFVNQKGEVIISRHYRDGFDRNIADVFRAQVITSKEV